MNRDNGRDDAGRREEDGYGDDRRDERVSHSKSRGGNSRVGGEWRKRGDDRRRPGTFRDRDDRGRGASGDRNNHDRSGFGRERADRRGFGSSRDRGDRYDRYDSRDDRGDRRTGESREFRRGGSGSRSYGEGRGFRRDDRRPYEREERNGRAGFRRDDRDDRAKGGFRQGGDRGNRGFRRDNGEFRRENGRDRSSARRDDRDGGRFSGGRGDVRAFGGDRGRSSGGREEGWFSRDEGRGDRAGFRRSDRDFGSRNRGPRRYDRDDRDLREDRRGPGGYRDHRRGPGDPREDDRRGFRRDYQGDRRSYGRGERRPYEEEGERRPYRREERTTGPSRSRSGGRVETHEDEKRSGEELPPLPPDITADDLDPEVFAELRSLPNTLAEFVARHLVAAERALAEDDPDRAYEHAKVARRFASRVGVVREAAGVAAYRAGQYADALSDLRAARRLTGSNIYLPIMADCERGLGRPERALDLIHSPEARRLDRAGVIELAMVESGARRDLGQHDAAVVTLQRLPELRDRRPRPWSARLAFAYADALADAGQYAAATDWFGRAMAFDEDGETDAAERYAELTGGLIEDIEDIEEDYPPDAALSDEEEEPEDDDLDDHADLVAQIEDEDDLDEEDYEEAVEPDDLGPADDGASLGETPGRPEADSTEGPALTEPDHEAGREADDRKPD